MSKSSSSAHDQIAALERQKQALLGQAVDELKAKLNANRREGRALEEQIARFSGKAMTRSGRRTRITVNIDQIKEAIKAGATNYKKVGAALHCSPLQVAKRVQASGKKAGITTEGAKATFRLGVK